MSVLHTGSSYADDWSDTGVLYHYPRTKRPGYDASAIGATKAAGEHRLPVFVVSYPKGGTQKPKAREVRLGWVHDWSDQDEVFLILFGETAVPGATLGTDTVDERPFELTSPRKGTVTTSDTKARDPRFRFEVMRRYRSCCAVCDVTRPELLDAVHIRDVQHSGSDDVRNGLMLCALHHRAFDAGLFHVEPARSRIIIEAPETTDTLRLQRTDLRHLTEPPHRDALEWRWKRRKT